MMLVGLDLNASRARAVSGPPGASPRPVPLDGKGRELPLLVSLEGRRPEVGAVAMPLCRKLPHAVCQGFLSHVGEANGRPREWSAGRHRLNAHQATGLVWQRLAGALAGSQGIALSLPGYLTGPQVGVLASLAEKSGLPVLGSVSSALAAVAAVPSIEGSGLVLVVDVDDHAMTFAAVAMDVTPAGSQAQLVAEHSVPQLGLRIWKDQLINAIADRCIRQSRRDPRVSAEAEQGLYDQLDGAMLSADQGRAVDLVIQAAHWYQNLILPPQDLLAFARTLAKKAQQAAVAILAEVQAIHPPDQIYLTTAAGLLPGLRSALLEATAERTQLHVLGPDAIAQSTHQLACRWQEGSLPRRHIDRLLPLAPNRLPISSRETRSDFKSAETRVSGR